jgi:hypothetical protein
MDMVYFYGRTENRMKVSEKMGNRMELVYSLTQKMDSKKKANGLMVKEPDGLKTHLK